ncbi:NADH:flavin oxidoreductase/NADH oxidase [bacterium]|nr:NADH:flavin oxidoreductase/NADH oxidase [bacterium]
MSALFSPLQLRGVVFRNRVFVSPMCQYSAPDAVPADWHVVHYGARAVGGAGLVLLEATAVAPEGRITPYELGLWDDAQIAPLARLAALIRSAGCAAGIQLGHAGRKASCARPWEGGEPLPRGNGGWEAVAPSPVPFAPGHPAPRALAREELPGIAESFAAAARRAARAGFDVVEIHAAHGYLLHQFLSPLSNLRGDEYGGMPAARMRFPLEVTERVRAAWPDDRPLFVRISATDWIPGGWDLEQSIVFARELKARGVDFVDTSSGGLAWDARIPLGPGYQVPFAAALRREAGVPTGAVGLITEARQAEEIVATGAADAVLVGRAALDDPHWALHAARVLGADAPWPAQYLRAKR